MKKILLSSAFILMATASANAEVNLNVDLGAPVVAEPAVVEPGYAEVPDWPSARYDHHRFPHNDYWAHHQHDARAAHVAHPVDEHRR